MEDKKQLLLSKVKSSLGALLYHDRKECEDLNREDVSLLFDSGYMNREDLKQAYIKEIDNIFDS